MNDIKPIDCHSHKSAAERMHYTVKLENKSILSFLVPLSYNKNMEMAFFFSFEYKETELMEVKKSANTVQISLGDYTLLIIKIH